MEKTDRIEQLPDGFDEYVVICAGRPPMFRASRRDALRAVRAAESDGRSVMVAGALYETVFAASRNQPV